MYIAADCLRLVGQHFLFAGDHVKDGPRGQHDVERQCATEREDDGLTELFHEQPSSLGLKCNIVFLCKGFHVIYDE